MTTNPPGPDSHPPGADTDPVELVRSGYNKLSRHYRGDDDAAVEYEPWHAGLEDRLPAHAKVLDIGCGCGVPVARRLTKSGHRVIGVDVSDVQIERAPPARPGRDFLPRRRHRH